MTRRREDDILYSDKIFSKTEKAGFWVDEKFPLTGALLDTAAGRLDYNYFNGGVDFASNAQYPGDPVSMLWQIQHTWQLESNIYPHIHWLQSSSNIPNWLLAHKIIKNNTIITKETDFTNHTFSTIFENKFNYASGNLTQISEFPTIDLTGVGISDFIHFVLFRDAANTSGEFAGADPSSSAELNFEFDIHIVNDAPGSRTEYIK